MGETINHKIKIALYATVPFQLRVLEPIAKEFETNLISFDAEEIKAWNPDVIVVSAEHEIPLFRNYCDKTNCALVALRHGAGFKYVKPPQEYKEADYICGSEWDQKDFARDGIKPRKKFLLTGNAWVDGVFNVPSRKLNTTSPTFLFAPTWNPDTSAAKFFEGKLIQLIRKVFPESKIVLRPHPNILTYDHKYLQQFADLYKRWINDWQQSLAYGNVEFVTDPKIALPTFFDQTDVMISDASTAIFEFMALNRPILLYTSPHKPEIENYDPEALGNKLRNVGKEFSNEDEFVESLSSLFEEHDQLFLKNQIKYSNEIFGKYQDGKSTNRVISAINNLEERNNMKKENSVLKITKAHGDGSVLMDIGNESEFAKAINELFQKIKPQKIIETGTHLGTGTTTIIANSLKALGLTDTIFHTIEVNPDYCSHAFDYFVDSGLIKQIYLNSGLSVPRSILPTLEEIKNTTVDNIEYQGIYIDHYEQERADLYYKETDFKDTPDDLLGKCLKEYDYKPDFVLLDSAGHMGFIEFQYLINQIESECYIALDDVYHIKHHKSFLSIQSDSRFELIVSSKEKFGFCIAKFTPKQLKKKKQVVKENVFLSNQIKPLPKNIIAIGLVEHIGDIIACEPVSRYVRNIFPDAYIIWVTKPGYKDLIESNPHINEAYPVSCLTEWIFLKNSGLFQEVIDLHIQNRVCPTCNVPLEKVEGRVDITLENYYDHGNLLSAFCQNAGLPILTEAPQVYIRDFERQGVDLIGLPKEYVVFHCLSNEYTRDWKDENWIELARKIKKKWNLQIVEVGHRSVLSQDKTLYTINLCGRLSILQTAEVVNRAKVFVGIDSAIAHAANAVNTYGIILLGEYRAFKKYTPYSGNYSAGINSELIYSAHGPASEIPVVKVLFAVEKALQKVSLQKEKRSEPDYFASPFECNTNKNLVKDFLNQNPFRLISLYLPQFHPFPENDSWWGKGFTEWTNVSKAKPLFPGHYQPHLPSDLGFYDLRLDESRIAQAELAKQYGLEGFCYYHYWFNGRRLLERPFNEVLKSGKPDLPFCLAWANENWTKRWDGREAEMLQEQVYGGEDDAVNHFKWLYPAFLDKRYIRIDNKPVFMIYRPSAIPELEKVIKVWRELAKRSGIGGIYLVAMRTGFEKYPNNYWLSQGFDAELVFQPGTGDINKFNKWQSLASLGGEEFVNTQAIVVDYDKAWPIMASEVTKEDSGFACVVPSWDNTARRAKIGAWILNNSTPEEYQKWLMHEMDRVLERGNDKRVVFINAWNEWAEGNHLEPDMKHGHGYLEATRNAVTNSLANLAKTAISSGDLNSAESYCNMALFKYSSIEANSHHNFVEESASNQTGFVESRFSFDKNLSEIHLLLGIINYKKEEKDRALFHYEQAIAFNNGNVLASVCYADLCNEVNLKDNLTNTYQNLFLLEDHTKTLLTLGRLLDSVGNKNAILFIKTALENGIRDSDIGSISEYDKKLLQLSGLAHFGSSITSAINVLKGVSLFNQANTYLNEGSYEEAKRCFTETMKLLPNHTTSLAGYAIVLKQLGESDAAIETMQKAISLEPGNYQLIKILADLHSELGNYKEAIHIYRQLLALDPNNTDLLMSVAKLQLTLGDYNSAEKLTMHVLEIEPKNQLALDLKITMSEKSYSAEIVNV